jgi:hypothetical protein
MEIDEIKEVSIDSSGRLFVQPKSCSFPQIYREAMEVHWDPAVKALYSPIPREWSYPRWFQQIAAAAKEQSCILVLSADTHWRNVPAEVKEGIWAVATSQ